MFSIAYSRYTPRIVKVGLDWQPPEGGFERYRIYVNVHGAAFPVEKVEKFNLIIPLTTFNDGYDD